MRPPKHWQQRAEEARAHLANMKDPDAIEAMRLVVENYEKLAAIAGGRDLKRLSLATAPGAGNQA